MISSLKKGVIPLAQVIRILLFPVCLFSFSIRYIFPGRDSDDEILGLQVRVLLKLFDKDDHRFSHEG